MDVTAYNTPRLLGNIYNVITNASGGNIPALVNSPSITGNGDPIYQGAGSGAYGEISSGDSGNRLYYDATQGLASAVTLGPPGKSPQTFNGGFVTNLTITTPDTEELPGHTFNYAISVFGAGVGLPYVPGSHIIVFHVGDYAQYTITPDVQTNKGLGELVFDLDGDATDAGNDTWSLGDSGITLHKEKEQLPSGRDRQSLNIYGYIRKTGFYRITLNMSASEIDAPDPDKYYVKGEHEAEAFLICILPFGPQVGDLYVVPQHMRSVIRDPIYVLTAATTANPGASVFDVVNFLTWAIVNDNPAGSQLVATYHDAVWAGAQVDTEYPPEQTYTHDRGYWTLDITGDPPSSGWPAHLKLLISKDRDAWRVYLHWDKTGGTMPWAIAAIAPLRFFGSAVPSEEYPPFYFTEVSGEWGITLCFKGNQMYSLVGTGYAGIYSYAGTVNRLSVYAQEPICNDYPQTRDIENNNNYLLYRVKRNWIVAASYDDTPTAEGVRPVTAYPPAVLYATPKPIQNHGGVSSYDTVLAANDKSELSDYGGELVVSAYSDYWDQNGGGDEQYSSFISPDASGHFDDDEHWNLSWSVARKGALGIIADISYSSCGVHKASRITTSDGILKFSAAIDCPCTEDPDTCPNADSQTGRVEVNASIGGEVTVPAAVSIANYGAATVWQVCLG